MRATAYLEHVVLGSILQVTGTFVSVFKLCADHGDDSKMVTLSYERIIGGCFVVE